MRDLKVGVRIEGDARGAQAAVGAVNKELGAVAPAAAAAGAAAARAGDQVEGGMSRARAGVQSISQQLDSLRQQFVGAVAGAATVGTALSVAAIADEYAAVSARLKNAVGDSVALATAQDAVFEVAQRTRSSLAATGDLVASLARSYTAAGLSAEQAFGTSLRLGEAINNAITASGTSAATAQGMITQLGQALASGALRGDEFNSMMEGSPRLAQALAAGMNVPIGKLREMAEAGELTRERITAALTGVEFDKLAAEASAMPLSLAQGWQQVTNAFQQYVGRANAEAGATSALAGALKTVADNLGTVIEGALRLGAALGVGLGVRALLPLLATLPATLTATATGLWASATAATSAHAAFTLTATSLTRLQMAAVGIAAVFAGWQIGTLLREQFVEVEVAGIGMVTGLARGYEYLRSATEVVTATIAIAFANMVNGAKGELAGLLSAFADFAQVELPAGLRADFTFGAADSIRALAAEMTAGIQPARSYSEAYAEIGATLGKNLAAVDAMQTDMLDAAIETRSAGAAAKGAAVDIAALGPAALAAGKGTNELAKAADAAAKALAGITRGNASAEWSELTRAAVSYGEQLTQLRQIEIDLQAAGQLTLQRQAELAAARETAGQAWLRTVDATTAAQQRAQAAVDGLIPQIRAEAAAVGMSAEAREVLRARLEAEAEMRQRLQALVQTGVGVSDAEAAALIRNAGAAAAAAAAQGQVAEASRQAAQESASYWGGAGDAISNALGEGLVSGFKGTADRLKNILKQLLADMAAAIVRQRLVIPIMTALGLPTSAMAGGGGAGGLLQSLLGGGGGAGGGGLLGSIGSALGLGGGGGGLLGSIGGAVSSGLGALGSFFGIGGGAAAASGAFAGAVGAAGVGAGVGAAGAASAGAGAFAGATAGAAAAATGFGAAIMSAIPVIGQIAAVAMAINALAGGRLFGTSRRPESATQTIGLGEGGGTASATMTTVRQRSLFRGRAWNTSAVDAGDEAEQAAQQLFESVRGVMVQAARQMEATAPEMIAASLRTVQQFDKDGKVKATQFFVDVLGRTWEEASAEAAASRISAEALIATIDAALGTTVQAATDAATGAGGDVVDAFGAAIGAAAGGAEGDLRDGITTMLKGASGALQGEASAIADRWRSDAAALVDGAQLLLAAATDIRRGAGLLGDGSLTAVADLIEDMAVDGESLAAAYARVSASTQMLEQALELSSLTLDRTREEFVRLAAGITDAAGGLDRAQQLWSSFYQGFFTEQERALLAQQRAMAAAVREFEDIGRNVGDFQGAGGLQAFRAAFDQVLQTGSAEAIVQWLEAAEALGILTQATAQLGTGAALAADSLADFMSSIDAGLAELTPTAGLAEQIEAQRAANAELIARAQELGASESELARVRQLGDARIQEIIGSVSQQTATLTGALRRLGITVSGSATDIAVLASQISGDFADLVEEFLGSFYDPVEQGAMRLALAQSTLTSALEAAGLATDELISREQLRAQIEAALAAGNIALAESLLRVASAMNAVDAAAGNAAGNIGQGNNNNGNQFGGNPGGSGLGFGGEGSVGGAGNDLAQTIADIQRGLREWLAALTAGDLSPLRPRDQLQQQRAELARLVAAAQAGDLDAMRQLSSAGDAVLRLGQQVFRGEQYRALFDEVRRLIGGVAGVGVTPIGGGGPGGGGRPGDDLGDLGRSAISAAAALDLLAARAGMPPGSLQIQPPRPLPQFGGVASDQAFEASTRPVVTELQRGRTAAAEDNARLRAEIAELSAQMRELRVAAARQTEQLARVNDNQRVGSG